MINSAQYLRAVAAVVVVLFHASVGATVVFGGGLDTVFRFGVAGVDVFFVLSGFIMYVSLSAGSPPAPLDFLRRRAVRIVPLYWIATLCLALLYWRVLLPWIPLHPGYVASSLLFVPMAVPDHPGEFYPLLSVGWTLNYEMFFYLLIGLSILVGRAAFAPVLLGIVLALFVAGRMLAPEAAVPFTATSPLILEFAGGFVVGMAFRRGVRVSPVAGAAAAVVAVAVVLWATPWALGPHLARLLVWGLPAMILVAAATLPRSVACENRGMLLLGDASYSIYLFHPIVITALQMAWLRSFGPQESLAGGVAAILAAVLLGCGVGVAVHLVVEKPLTRHLRWLLGEGPKMRPSIPSPAAVPAAD